jgi:predicted RNA polymerase sigma factor
MSQTRPSHRRPPQAAIASLQLEDPVDWPQVAALYERLAAVTRSAVVKLNQAVALADTGQLERALAVTDGLALEHYQYLHSTRAELLRRLGRLEEARGAYDRRRTLRRVTVKHGRGGSGPGAAGGEGPAGRRSCALSPRRPAA